MRSAFSFAVPLQYFSWCLCDQSLLAILRRSHERAQDSISTALGVLAAEPSSSSRGHCANGAISEGKKLLSVFAKLAEKADLQEEDI